MKYRLILATTLVPCSDRTLREDFALRASSSARLSAMIALNCGCICVPLDRFQPDLRMN
jgi:hypothetical protein